MKKLLFAAMLLGLVVPAQADTITVFATNNFGSALLAQSEIIGLSTFFPGITSGGVVSALHSGNTYELAANDVHNTIPDTLNIYALWQGLVSPTGLVTVTTQMATDEFAFPGWVISEQIYLNGTIVDTHTQFGLGGPPTETFSMSLGVPFDLQLQLQFVSNGAPPYGDFGAYVIASLDAPTPVPGPIVGTGLPGLMALGLLWLVRRRKKIQES